MHTLALPPDLVARVRARLGRDHAYDRLVPAKTALLVVDMQNYFVAEGMPASNPTARIIPPTINRLAAALRGAGGRVVWIVTEALPEDSGDWPNLYALLGREGRARRHEGLARESEGYRLWPAMDARAEDWTSVKTRYSAFAPGAAGTAGLDRRLTAAGIDTVLVAGTATNVCCDTTARDAMMRGFRAIMVHDALAAEDDARHNASLATLYELFADVQSADEIAAALAR
jgi:ureidoacrylate peracid hydrolase